MGRAEVRTGGGGKGRRRGARATNGKERRPFPSFFPFPFFFPFPYTMSRKYTSTTAPMTMR